MQTDHALYRTQKDPEALRKIEALLLPEIRNAKNLRLQSVGEDLPDGETPYPVNGWLELPGGLLQFSAFLSTGNKMQFIDNGKPRRGEPSRDDAVARKIEKSTDDNPRDAVKEIFQKIRRALDIEL